MEHFGSWQQYNVEDLCHRLFALSFAEKEGTLWQPRRLQLVDKHCRETDLYYVQQGVFETEEGDRFILENHPLYGVLRDFFLVSRTGWPVSIKKSSDGERILAAAKQEVCACVCEGDPSRMIVSRTEPGLFAPRHFATSIQRALFEKFYKPVTLEKGQPQETPACALG